VAPAQSDTAVFARGLDEDWKKGEQRAIHRRPAVDILVRLGKQAPDRFGEGQLRTAQRLVKKWRAEAAHQLINSAEAVIRIEPLAVPALAIPRSEPTQRLNLSQ
jgi:hypothetical protein